MTKKNISLITLLTLLFVLCIGAAVYFFLQPKNLTNSSYKVDKYEDLVDWCNTDAQENTLGISCNALLLELRVIDTNNSCADLQVISKEKELENISLCGDGNVITYSNDVLDYKKLMPIDIQLSYTRDDLLGEYKLGSISVEKMSESYIQSVVNEDIANLVTLNKTDTTIQNSVDFCPSLEKLPDYVTEENVNKYTEFYTNNILSKTMYIELLDREFENAFLENWVDPTINILFACESSARLGYSTLCKSKIDSSYKNLELTSVPSFVSDWSIKTNSESDLISLKNISLVTDGMLYQYPHANYSSTWIINDLLKFISDANDSSDVYCSSYDMHEKLSQYNEIAKEQLRTISTLVANNISQASRICMTALDQKLYSREGIYLKSLYTKGDANLALYNICNNLYQFVTNEN